MRLVLALVPVTDIVSVVSSEPVVSREYITFYHPATCGFAARSERGHKWWVAYELAIILLVALWALNFTVGCSFIARGGRKRTLVVRAVIHRGESLFIAQRLIDVLERACRDVPGR